MAVGSPRGRSRSVVAVVAIVLLAGCQVTSRVSQSSSGAQANGASAEPALSDDGQIVAFTSAATNLVAGDTNGWPDVFVHDRRTATTVRVSVPSGGGQGNGGASAPSVSGDGRYVAFVSAASNLVAGDGNGLPDVFVHDRQTGLTMREGAGGANPALDDLGRTLAYDAGGQLVVRDRQAGTSQVLPTGVGTVAADPDLSGDGRFVTFTLDIVGSGTDVWMFDRQHQLLDRLSYSADSAYGPRVSDDGATVVWGNGGNDRILMIDGQGVVTSFPGNPTYEPDVSDDGRFVVYRSEGVLVEDDTNDQDDTIVYDRATQTVERVSVGTEGQQGDRQPTDAVISGDGRHVAFVSPSGTLVEGDTNGVADVFVRDRGEESTATPA